jgi:hypothetical protein
MALSVNCGALSEQEMRTALTFWRRFALAFVVLSLPNREIRPCSDYLSCEHHPLSQLLMSTSFFPNLVIPDDVIEKFSSLLAVNMKPSSSDEDLKKRFHMIWFLVSMALSKIPDLEGLIASKKVYDEKVHHLGEGEFCELLRGIAISKDWHSLFKNGIFLSFMTPTNSLASTSVSRGIFYFPAAESCNIAENNSFRLQSCYQRYAAPFSGSLADS